MRLVICCLAIVAFVTPAQEVDACSCARSGVTVWPNAKTSTPTNAHIFVRFPGAKKEKVIVRLAGSNDTDGLPSERVDVVSMDVRFVELKPSVRLAAGASFEIVVGSAKKSRVVSTFVVGKGAEAKSVPPLHVKKVSFRHVAPVCCNCSSGQPHVVIELGGREDTEERELFGVWSADSKGKVDWSREPDAYVRSWYGRLVLGDSSSCSANNFPVPTKGEFIAGVRQVSQTGKRGKGKVIKVKAHGQKEASRF